MNREQPIRRGQYLWSFLQIIFFMAGLLAQPVHAGTVANGEDSGDGSLRKVIADASNGDTILFGNVTAVILTSATLTIDKNLTFDGGTGVTIQRSTDEEVPDFRIFDMSSNIHVTLVNMTLTNGRAPADTPDGGGIHVNSGAVVTLEGCTVSGNMAGNGGGGGGMYGNSATLSLTNSVIMANAAGDGHFNEGDSFGGGHGGGICLNGGTLSLTVCVVKENTAGNGGYGGFSGYSGRGGGICADDQSTVKLKSCTVTGNTTGRDFGFSDGGHGGSGGGIYVNAGTLALRDSTVSDNRSGHGGNYDTGRQGGPGGGVYVNAGTLTVKNCTVSDNAGGNDAGDGGGFHVDGSTVTMEKSTVTRNVAEHGGGLFIGSESSVTIKNSILANNTASEKGPDCHGAFTSHDHNLIGNTSDCTFTAQEHDQTGTGAVPLDPALAPLAQNGGPTQTHALQASSPAINAGSCHDISGNAEAGDQRGYFCNDGECDIGAFEHQGSDAGRIFVRAAETGENDGTCWADAYTSLQLALNDDSAKEIWVASGTYIPGPAREDSFQLRESVAVYGGFNGSENFFGERDLKNNLPAMLSGSGNNYHVVIGSGVGSTAILNGFTITAGNAGGAVLPQNKGGGMYTHAGSPTVSNLLFTGNGANHGGAVYNDASSSPTFTNCVFRANSASGDGGAMYNYASSPRLFHCTFHGNSAANQGGGIYSNAASPAIANSIFWANGARVEPQIGNVSSSPSVTYSLVQDGYAGAGNISDDPLFVNPGAGDFHLTSASPAIDAGSSHPGTDMDGVERPQSVRELDVCDMGAYEFVDQPPVVAVEFGDVSVYEDVSASMDLNGRFTDADSDDSAIILTLHSNSNETLVTPEIITDEEGNVSLSFDLQKDQYGEATIVIRATSGFNTVDATFAVRVYPVDDPPTVANEIQDVVADEDAPNKTISLKSVFIDVDHDDSDILTSVISNSKPSLLSASISDDILTLDFHEDQNGEATLVIQGRSAGKTVEDEFAVAVTPMDDPPRVTHPIPDIVVAKNAPIQGVNLLNVFTDVDGEGSEITKSLVSNSNGQLLSAKVVGERVILDFQEGASGIATIVVRADSGGQISDDTFIVRVYAIEVSDIEKANDTPVSITFTPDDFKNRFIGDMLAKVRISSLPSHGTLKLGQNDVSAGQEIRLESVDDLIFHPVSGYEGQDSFGWNGSNGNVYATVGASVNMTIISGGRVLGFSKTNDGALLIPFTLEEFSGHFDGDDLVKIRVTSLPLNGRVRLGESEVAENQEILLDDLNRLTYHPDPEFEGEDRFEWNGSNGTFYAENGASVSLTITVMPGDINYDGGVDLKDAIIGLQILAGILPMELTSPAADVNGDGRIGLEDVVHIFMVMTKSS